VSDQPQTVTVSIKRKGSSLGIASIVLGVLAFTICWIPFLGVLGMPLSALGLLLGAIGVLVALLRKGASIGFPIAGVAISGIALTVAWSMTTAIATGLSGIGEAAVDAQEKRNATNQTIVGDEQTEAVEAEAASVPEEPTVEWASIEHPIRQGDLQLRFVSAKIGKVEIEQQFSFGDDGTAFSENELLAITLELTNLSETKKIDYKTWAGEDVSFRRDFATLIDEYENSYARVGFGFSAKLIGRTESASIRPGERVTDVLVFETPIDAAEALRLELPARNFGGEGMLRIEIPVRAVEREADHLGAGAESPETSGDQL